MEPTPHSPCFGAYENERQCASCILALACIDATIHNDQWFDEWCRKEDEKWIMEFEGKILE